MKIDSHHHFWKYSKAEYGWMSDEMDRIRRDFLPADLEAEIRKAGVDGVVVSLAAAATSQLVINGNEMVAG